MATPKHRVVTAVYVLFHMLYEPHPSDFCFKCMGWCALSLCQFQWISQMITRSKLRHQHGIKGNGCTDCLISGFCGCCALVQEKEVEAQEEDKKHIAPEQQPPMIYMQPQ